MVPADLSEQARPYAYALVCFTLIAASALLTQVLCPLAAGGGVPEMKTVLRYFSLEVVNQQLYIH
jgi:hypothetical protein